MSFTLKAPTPYPPLEASSRSCRIETRGIRVLLLGLRLPLPGNGAAVGAQNQLNGSRDRNDRRAPVMVRFPDWRRCSLNRHTAKKNPILDAGIQYGKGKSECR